VLIAMCKNSTVKGQNILCFFEIVKLWAWKVVADNAGSPTKNYYSLKIRRWTNSREFQKFWKKRKIDFETNSTCFFTHTTQKATHTSNS